MTGAPGDDVFRPPQAPLSAPPATVPAWVRLVGVAMMVCAAAPWLLTPPDQQSAGLAVGSLVYGLTGIGLVVAPARCLRLGVYVLGLGVALGGPLAVLTAPRGAVGAVLIAIALQLAGVAGLSIVRWRLARRSSRDRLAEVLEEMEAQRPPKG